MIKKKTTRPKQQQFEPLQIMGVFWVAFGIIVLAATFFVKSTEFVPQSRGIVTNIIAGLLLVGVGVFSFIKGRIRKQKRTDSYVG